MGALVVQWRRHLTAGLYTGMSSLWWDAFGLRTTDSMAGRLSHALAAMALDGEQLFILYFVDFRYVILYFCISVYVLYQCLDFVLDCPFWRGFCLLLM